MICSIRRERCLALLLPLFFVLSAKPASAQTFQFLPEVDAYSKLTPDIRFVFQAKETREADDPTQAEIGPTFEFLLKPLVRLRDVSIFNPDEGKSRLLQLFVGFRYVPSPDKPHVERLQLGFTSNFPLGWKILMSDRNRADLDWENNQLTWRYRNKLKFERAFNIRSYHPAPYAAAEVFYQSQYEKWSTTALYAGCLLPVGKRYSFDPYYEHQNVTSKRPNEQYNQFGLIFNLYF